MDITKNVTVNDSTHKNYEINELIKIGGYEMKKQIFFDEVRKNFVSDIRDSFSGRYTWSKITTFFIITSKCFLLLATVVAFAETYFKLGYLAFIAGCFNLLNVLFLQFSECSKKESTDRTEKVNKYLKSIGLDKLLFDRSDDDGYRQSKQQNASAIESHHEAQPAAQTKENESYDGIFNETSIGSNKRNMLTKSSSYTNIFASPKAQNNINPAQLLLQRNTSGTNIFSNLNTQQHSSDNNPLFRINRTLGKTKSGRNVKLVVEDNKDKSNDKQDDNTSPTLQPKNMSRLQRNVSNQVITKEIKPDDVSINNDEKNDKIEIVVEK